LKRRDFLLGGLVCAAGIPLAQAAPAVPVADPQDWRSFLLNKGPRDLWLRRQETGESTMARYWLPKSGYQSEGYGAACAILRDVRANRMVLMDPNLLDLLYGIQSWLAHYGHVQPITINSGFRTTGTNDSLEGSARNSKHLYGQAADIVIPGVKDEVIGRMALILSNGGVTGRGGVGFYPDRGFIHVDTGEARAWVSGRRR